MEGERQGPRGEGEEQRPPSEGEQEHCHTSSAVATQELDLEAGQRVEPVAMVLVVEGEQKYHSLVDIHQHQ